MYNICLVYRRKIPRNGFIIDNTDKMHLVSARCFLWEKEGNKEVITIKSRNADFWRKIMIRVTVETGDIWAYEPYISRFLIVSDTKHTVMKRSACHDILYQNIHFLFILCSLSRQLSGSVSDQGRYASSNSGWFR